LWAAATAPRDFQHCGAVRSGYIHLMPVTLEDRVKTLEQRLEELASLFRAARPAAQDWRSTFGMSKDDPGFEEMNRLGRQYRTGTDKSTDGRS